jgi:hypothetical protein
VASAALSVVPTALGDGEAVIVEEKIHPWGVAIGFPKAPRDLGL